MQQSGLQESPPRQLLLDEDIAPQIEFDFLAAGQLRRVKCRARCRMKRRPNSAPEFRACGIAFH
jgi:hypothetical protein